MSDDWNSAGASAEDDKVLVAEYVLGLLAPAEHQRVAERLRDDESLRVEQRLWKLRLQSLDREFAEATAPAAVLGKVEARIFGAPARTGFWNSLALWRGLTAAGIAVAAIAIGINLATPRPDPQAFAAQLVAALHAEGSNVSFVALYNASTGEVRLTSLSGEPVPDKDYELWAIEGSQNPISMGVIPVDQKTEMKLKPDVLAGFGEGTVLAITLEPKGGSPTGKPTGGVVASGTATAI